MSPRERIQKEIFFKIGGHNKLNWQEVNECTDKVIELFKSLIDYKLDYVRPESYDGEGLLSLPTVFVLEDLKKSLTEDREED